MNFIQTGFKGLNNWWMYIVTLVITFIVIQLGSLPLLFVAFRHVNYNLMELQFAAQDQFMTMGLNANLFLFLMILTFIFGIVGLWLGVKFIHKKKFKWILTSRKQLDWKRIFYAFFLWAFVSIAFIAIGIYLEPEMYIWNFKLVPFLILVFVSLVFLPFQTSLEEFVFRGYLLQGIGISTLHKYFPFVFLYTLLCIFIYGLFGTNYYLSFFDDLLFAVIFSAVLFAVLKLDVLDKILNSIFYNKLFNFFNKNWMSLIITSVVFGLLHAANPEIEKLGYIALVFYIGTGFFFGIVTLLDEGCELALGLHAANNIVAAIFVTADWTVFQTDALYVDISEPSIGLEMFLPVFVVYPIIILLLSKKYGWTNWKEKLFGAVKKPIEIEA